MHPEGSERRALLALLAALDEAGYDFTTITPASHARVIARPGRSVARTLRDVLGWSLPFRRDLIDPRILDLLDAAGAIVPYADLVRATLRVSRVCGHLFLHSAYPTEAEDSVFLGPDTYRFVRFAHAELERGQRPATIVDIGAGAGVGGILAGLWTGGAVTLTDVNDKALALAEINAAHAGIACALDHGSGLPAGDARFDLIIANPPFIMDAKGRDYRDGGDLHGAGVSRDWVLEGASRLAPGGRMLLYTGVAIIDGRDELRAVLARELDGRGCTLRYQEIDPDIFGEELDEPPYAEVERIAAVGAVIERSS